MALGPIAITNEYRRVVTFSEPIFSDFATFMTAININKINFDVCDYYYYYADVWSWISITIGIILVTLASLLQMKVLNSVNITRIIDIILHLFFMKRKYTYKNIFIKC
jgi:hypothetical protein